MVTLPMTRAAFLANEEKYISSVAATAGVNRENVKVVNVDEVSTRSSRTVTGRLLLATLVNVQTSVIIATGDQTYFRDQTVLNSNLNKNGLPSGTLVVQNILALSSDITTPSPASAQGTSEASPFSQMQLIVGGSIGFSVLLAIMAFLVHRLRTSKAFSSPLKLSCLCWLFECDGLNWKLCS